MNHIRHRPRFDVAVISGNSDVGENAKHAKVFPQGALAHVVENERRGMIAEATAITTNAPFNPQQGQAHQNKTNDVGNHECAPAIVHGLHRKAQEVSKPNSIARHCKYQSGARPPGFFIHVN